MQAGDQRLNCQDIKGAIREANTFQQLADHEQGFTGTNVSSFLFWWPGLVATYINTKDAKEAAQNRKSHLAKIYNERKCDQYQYAPQPGYYQQPPPGYYQKPAPRLIAGKKLGRFRLGIE